MMILRLETYDGETCQLPTLLRWDMEFTGAVPCDSLTATCPYDPDMAAVLPRAVRFTALQEGRVKYAAFR